MNVWGVVVIILGIILIIIGVKGSQHEILSILHGVHLSPNASTTPGPGPGSGTTGTSQAPGTHNAGGRG